MIFAPASVDVIIDGNLANVEIATNFDAFIGSNPPIYTNKSFGVPGIINNIINTSPYLLKEGHCHATGKGKYLYNKRYLRTS